MSNDQDRENMSNDQDRENKRKETIAWLAANGVRAGGRKGWNMALAEQRRGIQR